METKKEPSISSGKDSSVGSVKGRTKKNKKDVARTLALRTQMSVWECEEVIDHVFDIISEAIKMNSTVAISRFGFFGTRRRDGKFGRNPKTGEKVWVAARRSPTFRPAISLKKEVQEADK